MGIAQDVVDVKITYSAQFVCFVLGFLVLHPQGICRPTIHDRLNIGEAQPQYLLRLQQMKEKGNPPSSSVRRAQSPGYESPLT